MNSVSILDSDIVDLLVIFVVVRIPKAFKFSSSHSFLNFKKVYILVINSYFLI